MLHYVWPSLFHDRSFRLRAIDQQEAAKTRKDEARNTLEGYLYRLRDLLDEENRDTPFKKCSKASERKEITEKLEASFTWLHEHGDVAETSQFLDKRISLEQVFSSYLNECLFELSFTELWRDRLSIVTRKSKPSLKPSITVRCGIGVLAYSLRRRDKT